MVEVILLNWREGLEKISLTKLQIEKLGLSLKEAKKNVDDLLDGKEISLKFPTHNLAKEFTTRAEELGVICKIVN